MVLFGGVSERETATKWGKLLDVIWKDLTVNFSHLNRHDLVENWHWLVGAEKQPILVSSTGDMFLEGDHGCVYFLDTNRGTMREISTSIDDFKAMLLEEGFIDEIFHPVAVSALMKSGGALPPGHVFAAPSGAASREPENRVPLEMAEHFKRTGLEQQKAHS